MPKGPGGEKRPADVIGNAVMVMKIATGEVKEPTGAGRLVSLGPPTVLKTAAFNRSATPPVVPTKTRCWPPGPNR